MTDINLTTMSDTEIVELATRCLEVMALPDRVRTILSTLHTKEEREELATWLNEAIEEEEDEEGEA